MKIHQVPERASLNASSERNFMAFAHHVTQQKWSLTINRISMVFDLLQLNYFALFLVWYIILWAFVLLRMIIFYYFTQAPVS